MKARSRQQLLSLMGIVTALVAMVTGSLQASGESESTRLSVATQIDGYYACALSQSGGRGTPNDPGSIPFRFYDSSRNSITLNSVEFIVLAERSSYRLEAGIVVGPWAEAMASGEASLKNVGHAVLTFDPWKNGWTFALGKMYSHVGLEGARSADNYNYSRSWIFDYGTPTWHTGARIGYSPSGSQWAGAIHLYNGWNTVNDNNSAKTGGLTLSRKLGATAVTYNVIAGAEQPGNTARYRVAQDINIAAQVSSRLALTADFVAGSEPSVMHTDSTEHDAKWYGAEGILSWSVGATTKLSGRCEWYHDETGFTMGLAMPVSLAGATLTLAQQLVEQLEVRVETRYDHGNKPVFTDGDREQVTLTIGLLAKL